MCCFSGKFHARLFCRLISSSRGRSTLWLWSSVWLTLTLTWAMTLLHRAHWIPIFCSMRSSGKLRSRFCAYRVQRKSYVSGLDKNTNPSLAFGQPVLDRSYVELAQSSVNSEMNHEKSHWKSLPDGKSTSPGLLGMTSVEPCVFIRSLWIQKIMDTSFQKNLPTERAHPEHSQRYK